ncbi:MAG: hypothetical protein A3A85_01255 [Deltaproteobacteria bacterium RIFCSPLOWO2_01_FULL_42_9]|nr:MAG: hypothetical protein A3A85_01255 [Deltaproteobacteria bacterium RIFCSPLOWO2_01_FULL_42_9]
MSQDIQQFDKYKEKGAYHWKEMRSGIKRFNAGLAARYEISKGIIFRNLSSPNIIVDIGCGDGFFSATIAERYRSANIVGYDFDETAIRLANEKKEELGYKNLSFHRGDAFEYKDVSLIVATDVIEHLNEPEDFMRRSFSMLVEGGYLFMSTPIRCKEFPDDKYHVHEFFYKELEDFCKSFKFEMVEHCSSHDYCFLEQYGKRFNLLGMGKMRFYKYYYNSLAIYLNKNVFEGMECGLPTMQYILLRRVC